MRLKTEDGLKGKIEAFYKGESAWWFVCELVPTKTDTSINFFEDDAKESGLGGLCDTLKTNPDKILICLQRVQASDDQRVSQKFIYISYIGTSVPVMTRSRVGTYSGKVQNLFSTKHLSKDFDTSDLGDICPEGLAKELLAVGGAHMPNKYVFGSDANAVFNVEK